MAKLKLFGGRVGFFFVFYAILSIVAIIIGDVIGLEKDRVFLFLLSGVVIGDIAERTVKPKEKPDA